MHPLASKAACLRKNEAGGSAGKWDVGIGGLCLKFGRPVYGNGCEMKRRQALLDAIKFVRDQ